MCAVKAVWVVNSSQINGYVLIAHQMALFRLCYWYAVSRLDFGLNMAIIILMKWLYLK